MSDAIDKKRGVVRKLQTSSIYGRFSERAGAQFIMWRFAPLESNAGIMANEFNGAVFEIRTEQGQVIDVTSDHLERKTGNTTLEVHNTSQLSKASAFMRPRETAELVKALLGTMIGCGATMTMKDWNEVAGRLERVRLEWETNDSERALITREWSEKLFKLDHAATELAEEFTKKAPDVTLVPDFVDKVRDALHDMAENYHGLLHSFFKPKNLAEAERIFRGARTEPALAAPIARDVQSSYPHRDFSTVASELPAGTTTKQAIDSYLRAPETVLADVAQIAFTEAGDPAAALERIRGLLR